MNQALQFVLGLVGEGYHPSSVVIDRGSDGWLVRVTLDDWAPHGEGCGNIDVAIDRDNLPEGVTVGAIERFGDRSQLLSGCESEEVAETWISEIANVGGAPDYARHGGTKWLTKPIEWLREPLRSALKRRVAK